MENKNISILVVEDEIVSLQYLISIIESLGFDSIYEASNANDALSIVKNNQIDLVFMDINIDGAIDGIKCADMLNEQYALPIIFTTAYGDSKTILEASDTNIYGYVIKPFEPNDIEANLIITLKKIKEFKSKKLTNSIISNNIINLNNGQSYDISNKTFYIDNTPIVLTKTELNILDVFAKNLNQNMSYEILKELAWKNKDISNSTIRDVISRLKRKSKYLNIENVVNFGYILK